MMFGYYLDLAWRSLKRNKVLTALMVLAIGLGIGASMTMLTVLHVMTANPIPGKSAQLFRPQLDPRPARGYHKGVLPPQQLTWRDAMNLLHSPEGAQKAAMVAAYPTVVPATGVKHAFQVPARYTTADFFRMFDVPFLAGHGWGAKAGRKHAHVAVIARALAEKLYGTTAAVGKTLRLGKYDVQVVGVIDDWNPAPHFYDLTGGNYVDPEQVFLPLDTGMDLFSSVSTSIQCWHYATMQGDLRKNDSCAWVGFWVQLDTPAKVATYRRFLRNYSIQQKQLGRFARPPNTRLYNVMQWLSVNDVVPGSVQLETMLALAFLLVCLVNTVALLLVKFLRRGGPLSVRRAMGASRGSIFLQLLVEAGMIGLAGGVVGLLLSLFGLWVVRQQPADYAALANLDGAMLVATFVLAIVATLLAALFPAWRACRLMPARLLKTQ